MEPAFQNIAGQMAAIKAMRAKTRLLPPDALPARERAAKRIDEGFWRQARPFQLCSILCVDARCSSVEIKQTRVCYDVLKHTCKLDHACKLQMCVLVCLSLIGNFTTSWEPLDFLKLTRVCLVGGVRARQAAAEKASPPYAAA